MRQRVCARVVDARRTQSRIVLWLECNHKLSIGFTGDELPSNWVKGGLVNCHFCPDPTAREERREKTAVQLYKEAGEP